MQFTFDAIADSGAFTSALPLSLLEHLKQVAPSCVKPLPKPNFSKVKVASGALVSVLDQVSIFFTLGGVQYSEPFIVLQTMNSPLLGLPFFENNGAVLDFKRKILNLPDFSFQINELSGPVKSRTPSYLFTVESIVIPPNRQELVTCQLREGKSLFPSVTGIVSPLRSFEIDTELCITSSISTVSSKSETEIGVLNIHSVPITIPANVPIALFSVLTAEQARFLVPIDPRTLSMIEEPNFETYAPSISACTPSEGQENECWFPTPETCSNTNNLTSLEKAIYNQIAAFQKAEKLNPLSSVSDRHEFLQKFNWKESILTDEEKGLVEDLLVEFNDIFARHRLDVGCNKDFKITLTPEHDKPVYTQGRPTPIHLRDELLIELALMQYYGIIRTLPYSKYSSPIFAQRKASGKLRILIDLRRINHLIRHDYDTHNFPISTLADAGHHLAGKKYFCKLDCSQAYYALQMADEQSIQLLAFNFGSRTYAYQRLAQGLSRSVSAFSSFMRKHMDPCIATNKCFQYVDDIGTAVHTAKELLENLRAIFECIRQAGVRLSIEKCQIGVPRIEFLGSTITSQGMSPNEAKVQKFMATLRMPKNKKQIQRFLGFVQYFRAFIPQLSDKVLDFYKLLQKDAEFVITEDHTSSFTAIKLALTNACKMSLRLPRTDCQYVVLADASFYAAGYVLLIEDYAVDSKGKDCKQYAPVSFGSKVFSPAQLKLSIYAKEFLAVHYAFDNFAHLLWGADKPTLVLTDNKSLTRFFQAKQVPPTLWNCVDHVLAFNFILGHIPGKANLAADFLSRIHINPEEKLMLKITDRIPIHDVKIELSSQTPDNELCSLDFPNNSEQTSEDVFTPINAENLATITLALLLRENEVSYAEKFSTLTVNALHASNPLDEFDFSNRTSRLNMAIEQAKDKNIRKAISWIQNGTIPDITYAGWQVQKYHKQLPRLVFENNILWRKFFDDTGNNHVKQLCVPTHLRAELMHRLHNSPLRGHSGIDKTIHDFRQRFYFPGFTEFLYKYISNCSSCLQTKPLMKKSLIPPLHPLSSQQNFPADLLQIDIVGKLPISGGFTHIVTAMDVFSKYLFTTPVQRVDAPTVARALFAIFMKHSYIPTTILTDMGTVFTSALFKELSTLLEIQLDHATLKHAQTIGLLERSHAPLKTHLKIYGGNMPNNWHTHVAYATFCHNTTFHSAIKCTPSSLFHGREPFGPLDLRFNNRQMKTLEPNFDTTAELQDNVRQMHARNKTCIIEAYHKYRQYYDRKAHAKPLQRHSYCLMLNPKSSVPNDPLNRSHIQWLPLYRVEKILTHSNYIVRKVGTLFTHCINRVRLRPIIPQYNVEDVDSVASDDFTPDPNTPDDLREPRIFDKTLGASTEFSHVSTTMKLPVQATITRPNPPEAPQIADALSRMQQAAARMPQQEPNIPAFPQVQTIRPPAINSNTPRNQRTNQRYPLRTQIRAPQTLNPTVRH